VEIRLLLRVLALLTLTLTAADHWTTYLCLSRPVEGWHVSEANPVADWLFSSTGLVQGLAIDSAVTGAAIAFLLFTTRFASGMKVALLGFITLTTGYAVASNVNAMSDLGLSLLGVS
jgi:hypothetical protein